MHVHFVRSHLQQGSQGIYKVNLRFFFPFKGPHIYFTSSYKSRVILRVSGVFLVKDFRCTRNTYVQAKVDANILSPIQNLLLDSDTQC